MNVSEAGSPLIDGRSRSCINIQVTSEKYDASICLRPSSDVAIYRCHGPLSTNFLDGNFNLESSNPYYLFQEDEDHPKNSKPNSTSTTSKQLRGAVQRPYLGSKGSRLKLRCLPISSEGSSELD